MKIGILSECQRQSESGRRIPFWKKIPCGIDVIDEEKNGFCLTAVQLPYTLEQMETISDKKRLAALKHACDILLSYNIHKAVYTAGMKKFFTPSDVYNIHILQKGDVFCRFLPELVRRLSKKYQIDRLSARLGISDAGLGNIAQRLMSELCFDARYIQLYTSDTIRGEELSARFSDEFGMPIAVSQPGSVYRCDILIDLDHQKLRIGRDLVVDGLELDFEVGNYDVDTMEISNGLDIPSGTERIRYCISGKKKLTL